MDERYPDEFITWRHKAYPGIKVDEIFGMDSKSGKVWLEMARQIFAEQSDHYYRVLEHYENGAPYMEGYDGRISVTHTSHFMAVASVPKTPELNLKEFNPRNAMGIDAEAIDRTQVLKIREKFLSDSELELIDKEDLTANIIAWTSKEALYKAALTPGLDFKKNIIIKNLPEVMKDPLEGSEASLGKASIIFDSIIETPEQEMRLYSYLSYGCCVTLAYSPKCVRFG